MAHDASTLQKQKDHERRVKDKMLTCKHFNGVQHDECRAGVNYRELTGKPELGCITRLPCTFGFEPKGGTRAVCGKREMPTQEEAEKRVADADAAMERHHQAFRKVHDDAKSKGYRKNHGGMSQCVCPICHGTIRYAVSSYNGHIHAKCETEGCVQWME